MPIQPMENMKTPHTFREEWMKSRYSTAEHYIPYKDLREKKAQGKKKYRPYYCGGGNSVFRTIETAPRF
jgi:hypothetical protein